MNQDDADKKIDMEIAIKKFVYNSIKNVVPLADNGAVFADIINNSVEIHITMDEFSVSMEQLIKLYNAGFVTKNTRIGTTYSDHFITIETTFPLNKFNDVLRDDTF